MEMYEQTENEDAARKRVYKQSTTRVNKTLQNPFTINGRTYKNLSDFLGVNNCMVYTTVDGKGYGGTAFNAYNDDWPILVRKVTDNSGNTVQEFSAISPIGFNGKLMDTEMDSGMVSNNLKSGVTSEIILLPWSTDLDRIESTLKNNINTLANAAEKNYQNTRMYAAGVGTIKDATGSTIKGASRQEAYVPRTTEEFEKYAETGVVPGGNYTPQQPRGPVANGAGLVGAVNAAGNTAADTLEAGRQALQGTVNDQHEELEEHADKSKKQIKTAEQNGLQNIDAAGDKYTETAETGAQDVSEEALDPTRYGGRRYTRDDMLNQRSYKDTLNLSRLTDKLNNRLYYRPGIGSANIVSSGNTASLQGGQRANMYQMPQIDTEERRNMELRRRLEQQRLTNEQELQSRWQGMSTDVLQQSINNALGTIKQFAADDANWQRQLESTFNTNVLMGIQNVMNTYAGSLRSAAAREAYAADLAERMPNLSISNELAANLFAAYTGRTGALRDDVLNEYTARQIYNDVLRNNPNATNAQLYLAYEKAILEFGSLASILSMNQGLGGSAAMLKNFKDYKTARDSISKLWEEVTGQAAPVNTAAGLKAN